MVTRKVMSWRHQRQAYTFTALVADPQYKDQKVIHKKMGQLPPVDGSAKKGWAARPGSAKKADNIVLPTQIKASQPLFHFDDT